MVVSALKSLYSAAVNCSGAPALLIGLVAIVVVVVVFGAVVTAVIKINGGASGGQSRRNPFDWSPPDGESPRDIFDVYGNLPKEPSGYKTETFEELKKKREELEKKQKVAELKAELQAQWGRLAKPESGGDEENEYEDEEYGDDEYEDEEQDWEYEDEEIEDEDGEYEDEESDGEYEDTDDEESDGDYGDTDGEEPDGDESEETEDEESDEDYGDTDGEEPDGKYNEESKNEVTEYERKNAEQTDADEKSAFQQDGEQTGEPTADGVPSAAEAGAQPEYSPYPVTGAGFADGTGIGGAGFMGGSSLETGRVVSVSPPDASGLCRVVFSIRTFEGVIESEAAVVFEPKYAAGSSHYVMLSGDRKTCEVL